MSKKRGASIKETGEELPDEQWKRFEAAVDAAVKTGPKPRLKGKRSKNGESQEKTNMDKR